MPEQTRTFAQGSASDDPPSLAVRAMGRLESAEDPCAQVEAIQEIEELFESAAFVFARC